jgi:prepilin-type N-terminal cleavage/methylation domain-containing protein
MKTKPLHRAAFTLVEIMIVVAIIGLLAAIAIPNFVRARATAQANACINNMRQIDGAINQWALENGKQSADAVTLANCQPYIKLNSAGNIPPCPAGGTYTTTTVGATPSVTCSLGATVTPAHVMP